jgi:hypothetical protein
MLASWMLSRRLWVGRAAGSRTSRTSVYALMTMNDTPRICGKNPGPILPLAMKGSSKASSV